MNTPKVIVLVGAAALATALSAAELTYNWGSADLSDAANWSAPPTADDVGVVDLSATGAGATLSVGSNLSLKGLRFTNMATKTTVNGPGTLTLGSEGLSADAAQFFDLKAPVVVAAAQTWTFAKTHFETFATISGTADLTISGCQGVWHRAAPQYGGVITYKSITEYNELDAKGKSFGATHGICYCTTGLWAKKIVSSARVMFMFEPTEYQSLSSLFSDKSFDVESYITFCYCRSAYGGTDGTKYPLLSIGEGETFRAGEVCSGGNKIRQTGGSFTARGAYYVGNQHAYAWHYSEPTHHYLEGGTFAAKQLDVGEYIKAAAENKCSFAQSGGTATITDWLWIGGGNQGGRDELAKVSLSGGTMSVNGAVSGHNGVVLYCPDTQHGYGRALFDMPGGTLSTARLMFGRNDRDATTSTDPLSGTTLCHDAYGLFDMRDGELRLGSGGIVAGANWNYLPYVVDKVTNTVPNKACQSYADVRLSGGKVVATADSTSTVAMRLPDAGGSLEWDTNGRTNLVCAPVFGKGELVKTGSGELRLTDATEFKGSVDVRAGTLRVYGAAGKGPTDGWRWTADAAAEGLADKTAVSEWTDLNNGLKATNITWFISKDGGKTTGYKTFPNPKVALNAFDGGHAGLLFDNAVLSVPADLNPLVDKETVTIAFAFKMNNGGGVTLKEDCWGYYSGYTMFSPGGGYYTSEYGPWFVWTSGGRVTVKGEPRVIAERFERTVTSKEGYSLNANKVHVCIAVVSGKSVSLMTDGMTTNVTWSPTTVPLLYRNGGTKNGPRRPFNIGGSLVDSWNTSTIGGMTIAELRIFDRGLSAAEQAQLTGELLSTYGAYGPSRFRGLAALDDAAASGGGVVAKTAKSYVTPRQPTTVWTADKLAETLEDGASVESWTSTNGTRALTVAAAAYQTTGGETVTMGAPTLVKDVANGHAAVRFDASRRTALAAASHRDVMPTPDWNCWACAVVFRSTQETTGLGASNAGAGLLTVSKGASIDRQAMQLAMVGNGEIRAMAASTHLAYRRPLHMNDGRTHVAVFVVDSYGGAFGVRRHVLAVDGIVNVQDPGLNAEIVDSIVSLGRLYNGTGLFSGDIMEVRWYGAKVSGVGLTCEEIEAISAELADKYDIRLYDKKTYVPGTLDAIGLGATNVSVAAGARLALPLSATAPYTAGADTTIELNGVVSGTLALGDGSMLKLDPATLAGVSVEALQVAAGATVDIVLPGYAPAPQSFQPLFAAGSVEVGAGATVRINGEPIDGELSVRRGMLGIRRHLGLSVILR